MKNVSVGDDLYRLNMTEFANATGLSRAPTAVQRLLLSPLSPMARVLADRLADFDAALAHDRVAVAARDVLRRFGAEPQVVGGVPSSGPLIVVTNHPGTYDALSLFVALGRDDVRIIVAERPFLRAMPNMQRHFLYVPDLTNDTNVMRAIGLRHAITHLKRGGALLQFAAGAIERDPAFTRRGESPFLEWQEGTAALVQTAARFDAKLAVAVVSGVHSRRAKNAWIVRKAEERGITTLASLLQVALPGFGHCDLRVRLSPTLRCKEDFAGLSPTETITRLKRIAEDHL